MNNFSLYDEHSFYQTFLQDLEGCQKEVIIESPYITAEPMRTFDRLFKNASVVVKMNTSLFCHFSLC